MQLKDILSISGKPGLFRMVGQMKNGIIVESLLDGKRFPAYSTHKVSALEDISIYGETEDLPLPEIFTQLYELEKGATSIDHNAPVADLQAKLREVFPEVDEERVYTSDLRKLFKWYNLLVEKGLLQAEEEAAEETIVEDAEVVEETTAEEASTPEAETAETETAEAEQTTDEEE